MAFRAATLRPTAAAADLTSVLARYKPTGFTDLPNEVVMEVADTMEDANDIRNLILTSRRYASILTPVIVRRALIPDPEYILTGLEQAVDSLQLESVKTLVSKGASLCSDTVKASALRLASRMGEREFIDVLLAAGADPTLPTGEGGTVPLHEAAQGQDIELMGFLIDECKVDINQRDNDGWTALHWASSGALPTCLEMTQFLIDAGADLSVETTCGLTAEQYLHEEIFVHGYVHHPLIAAWELLKHARKAKVSQKSEAE